MSKVLIIASHPDDELLGCGGSILRHISIGDDVKVIFMTNGEGSRARGNKNIKARNKNMLTAKKILGYKTHKSFNFPDNKMDTVPLLKIVQSIEKIIFTYEPSIVYTHHSSDLNIDHTITNKAVMTACRPQPNFSVKQILAFEVLSSTEWQNSKNNFFLPNYFINIESFIDKKIQAANAYGKEMRNSPHSRSLENIKNLAAFRGNTVGFMYAEAFELLRFLN